MATETAPDGWTIEWLPATITIYNAEGVPQVISSIQPSCLDASCASFARRTAASSNRHYLRR